MTAAKNIGNDIKSKLNRSKPDRYTFIDIPFRYRAHGTNCLPMENTILAADAIYDNQIVDTITGGECDCMRVIFNGDLLLCPYVCRWVELINLFASLQRLYVSSASV